MEKRTPVSEIMSTDIITVDKNQTLIEVSEIVTHDHIRHVPVVSKNHVVGMLSKTDLQKISFVNTFDGDDLTKAMYDSLSINDVMTKELTTVQQTDSIYDVAVLLSEHEFHAVPVLDGEAIVGIVTSTDLIKYLIKQY